MRFVSINGIAIYNTIHNNFKVLFPNIFDTIDHSEHFDKSRPASIF